jgi:hypothetical protein
MSVLEANTLIVPYEVVADDGEVTQTSRLLLSKASFDETREVLTLRAGPYRVKISTELALALVTRIQTWLWREDAAYQAAQQTRNEEAKRTTALEADLASTLNALSALEQDSQHTDHHCGDPDCPVDLARTVLRSHGLLSEEETPS